MFKDNETRQTECQRPTKSTIHIAILLTVMIFMSLFPWDPLPSYGKEPISISGITEPVKDVTLSATVVGTISAILVKEGMSVKM
jgi:multidrug efflux pump subunit AcrA (membrane-fusion protein)